MIFTASVILVLALFAGALYLLPTSPAEDKEEESLLLDTAAKRDKKEPIVTIVRNNKTGECIDKDGVSFPIDSLNKEEWDIVSKVDSDETTTYTLRYKGKSGGSVTSPTKGRKRK